MGAAVGVVMVVAAVATSVVWWWHRLRLGRRAPSSRQDHPGHLLGVLDSSYRSTVSHRTQWTHPGAVLARAR